MRRLPGASLPIVRVVLVVTALLGSGLLAGCSGDDAAGTGSSADSAATGSPAGAPASTGGVVAGQPPVASATPSAGISAAPSVKIGRPSTLKQNVSVRVVGIQRATLTAKGPGELAGAGAAVQVQVRNASVRPIDLDQLVVNAYYAPKKTPAVPNTSTSEKQLSGSLKAGAARTGTYYFKVPATSFGTLDVEVSSGDSPYVITFVHD